MAAITLHNGSGASAGTVELDDSTFGIEPNVPVMHQVVTAQLAAKRAGTQSTKTRAEVAGGGAKPWKQKGTGRARAGSSRSPIWRGGGVALGPKPRKYDQKTPKKVKKLENVMNVRYHESIAELFTSDDFKKILKYREIYSHMNHASDKGDMCANLIQDIIVKL